MTPRSRAPTSLGSVARTLDDIVHGLDSPRDAESRLRRALGLLRGIVPYGRCALLETSMGGAPRFIVEPDSPEERESLSRVLTRLLAMLTVEPSPAGWLPEDVAHLVPCASHLAVLLVGLDRVLGVLFVSHPEVDAYSDDDLRLLSIVGAQIAAYLTACRLHEQERQIADAHEAARATAEAESHAKDEFLAMLAHELRNPLIPIRIAMQTILGQAQRDRIVQRASDVVQRQLNHLMRLLDDLTDVSRLTRGKIELRKESVTLQMIVAAALETARGFTGSRQHVESVSLPDEPLWFEADPVRITQVLENLLDNAAKYTPAGGEISLTGYREGADVVLRLRDTGIGMSPEMLRRAFDLFAQADRSVARSERGLGVGLTLARTLVELHQGTITVESEGPGRGSEFIVRVPIGVPIECGGCDADRRASVRARDVLLVEDDDHVRNALRRILELDGHHVEAAGDGPGGVKLALAAAPEVAFIDIGLPGIDGYEVARRIRAALGRRVVLVAVTARGEAEDRRRSSEAGFDAHLVKPVSYEDLTRSLERVGPGEDR
jgi:signal transduction histidine kinase/ActR/RegA family two-component response regulator